jgi:peptide methionine sulfoxide reductase MsrA
VVKLCHGLLGELSSPFSAKWVVATRCGYAQGIKLDPTCDGCEDVCSGTTQHREAVQVLYDPNHVSCAELVQLALARWYDIALLDRMFQSDEDDEAMSI